MTLDVLITRRKHGEKKPQSFSHCGSFDHLGMGVWVRLPNSPTHISKSQHEGKVPTFEP